MLTEKDKNNFGFVVLSSSAKYVEGICSFRNWKIILIKKSQIFDPFTLKRSMIKQ